ncbi:MAG: bifunctional heptose 7-phosphate kinase/heptose 1-phosphate adenyltransferase [Bacillota bacterium]
MRLLDSLDILTTGKTMVIGDLIIDEFLFGSPARISREAPVLILEEKNREFRPGGAANAAYNIASISRQTKLLAISGRSKSWDNLSELLVNKGVDISDILLEGNNNNLKTRVIAGSNQVVDQQIVRIDKKYDSEIKEEFRDEIFNRFKASLSGIEAVLLSDYGYGVFNQNLIKKIISKANDLDIPVVVDSRNQLAEYKGATIATPNLEEASDLWGATIKTEQDLQEAGNFILKKLDSKYLLITRGADGMTLFEKGGYKTVPVANRVEVFDVTGAGDTVSAMITLALAAELPIIDGVRLANYAAGEVVKKPGVATVSLDEIREAINNGE